MWALAQGTCTSAACQYCGAIAAAGTYGCALGQGGNCQWYTNFVNACIASATALPSSPPPPPEPATPCPAPLRLGTQPRPAIRADSSNGASSSSCPCVELVDPFVDLVNPAGTDLVHAATPLSTLGRKVNAVVADSAARLVVRIYTNAVGDSVKVRLIGDGLPNSKGLPDPNGQLATLLPSDGNATGSEVRLTSVRTPKGPMAFAQYFPPGDFSRNESNDDLARNRAVTIKVTSLPTGRIYDQPVSIERPPVVLVHGLWGGEGDWATFTEVTGDPRFAVSYASYDQILDGRIFVTDPVYTRLVRVKASTMGLDYNAPRILDSVKAAIGSFRQLGIAVAQADVVGHSMGGLLTRSLPKRLEYVARSNLARGYVHKLITIGTPHLGSPVADKLLDPNNACIRRVLTLASKYTFLTADVDGAYWGGGVGDLRSAPLSSAIAALQSSSGRDIPTAMIAGTMTAANWTSLDSSLIAAGIRTRCGADTLASNLTSARWPSIFSNNDSDAIVSKSSQVNNGSGAALISGVVHSTGVISLGFTGPGELNEHATLPTVVKWLLNEPILRSTYVRLP